MNVHLGCWHRIIPGFVNVDLCDMPHIDYKSNIDALPFFQDGSVDLIYVSHAFEYFDRTKAVDVIKEWRRVLKTDGILRIAVPDFDKLIRIYQDTGELSNILGPLFGQMDIETDDGPLTLYHKTTYTFDSLSEFLTRSGFYGVERYDWRNTIHKDFDDHSQAYYPHLDKDNGILVSLNVECKKND